MGITLSEYMKIWCNIQVIIYRLLRKSTGSTKLYSVQVDLADMESVRNLAEIILQAEPRLDVLVCNGAILLDR